jgi:predicted phage terminase large subunit-like protein
MSRSSSPTTAANKQAKETPPAKAIRPHVGPQTKFLASKADIAIYGGGAGGGKTFAIELEPLRHIANPAFECVIFRRTSPEILKAGGLWDESQNIYPIAGGTPKVSDLSWTFTSGSRVSFGHIEHEKDLLRWHGSQIALICFDELTTFTEKQFWYMLSRNRSTCGIKPYIRATCNPDGGSWVAMMIAWWIDQDTGYPIPERSGVIRWFIRVNSKLIWADDPETLRREHEGCEPKSLTFIPASLSDNPTLMAKDPGYRANLMALAKHDQERLLGGNWKSRPVRGEFPEEWLKDAWFEKWPLNLICKTMVLDPSKGKNDKTADYQAVVSIGIGSDDVVYVQADMRRRPIDQMIADTVDIYRVWQPQAFGIEANMWQELLAPDFAQEFQRQNVLAPEVWQINNSINKQVRIRRLAGYLAHRRMRFMANCPGTQILIDQLLDFPGGDHDDGPDALEMSIRLAEQLCNGA